VRTAAPLPLRCVVKALDLAGASRNHRRMTAAPATTTVPHGPAPRISMVMPVFNGAAYLDAAINSVLLQDCPDFELICVDDGSTDATPRLLSAAAARDPRVRVSTNPYNMGLPATLNRGFTLARGPLHSWTSHDNLLRADMLSALLGVLDAAPDVDVAHAGFSIIDSDGVVVRTMPPGDIDERFFGNPVGCAFLYRRALTDTLGGYDESLFGAEDYDYWLRAARRFRFRAVDRDLYLYRRHGNSLTDKRSSAIKQMVVELVEREVADCPNPALRARALIELLTSDTQKIRLGLAGKALAASPLTVMKSSPSLARYALRAVRARVSR
jgi:hypothetical protein